MVTDSQWQTLKVELRKEARSLFYSMGDVVLIEPNKESDSELTLSRRAVTLKIRFVPERDAVRWETHSEYGFEQISEPIAQLARTLVKRLVSQG
jgi:hypothetical protein